MDSFTRISAQKAYEIIDSGATTIVDIRDAGTFLQGHITNAQNVNDENIEEFIRSNDKETPLICCCYHGISSQRLAAFFASQGFKHVYSIDGGWETWKSIYG